MPIHNSKSTATDFINRQWWASHIYVPGRAEERIRQEEARRSALRWEALAARSEGRSVPAGAPVDALSTFAFWANVISAGLIYNTSGSGLAALVTLGLGLALLKLADSSVTGRFFRALIHLALIAAPILLLGF